MKLRISADLSLPLDFITSTQAILAKKRVGKTYTAQVLAEELLAAGQQVVVIDVTSAWWGLRSSADGKSAGYPITIFGGRHGDLPLEATAGEVLANAIVTDKFSAVLDVRLLKKSQRLRFIADFLEALYDKNTEAMHLFLDEADAYIPQQTFSPEQARALGAADELVRRGGIGGIGVTMISQRAQTLNKNVLSQVDMLTVLRMNHPKDLAAIKDWVVEHVDADKAQEMMASLPSLPKGAAWVWAPELELFKRITVRQKRTYDSGRTPKVGEQIKSPKVLAKVDLERLGATIRETVERVKENDPKSLKAKIAELIKTRDQSASKEVSKIVAKPVLKDGQLVRIEKLLERVDIAAAHWSEATDHADSVLRASLDRASALHVKLAALAGELRETIKLTGQPVRVEPPPRTDIRLPRMPIGIPRHGMDQPPATAIGGGLRRMLIALAQRPHGLTNRQIGIRAGLSSRSGTFSTYISRARSEGWIEYTGDVRRITLLGIEALGHYDPLPTGEGLADYWLRELGTGGAARILRVVIDAYPNEVDASTIGERAKISPKSGTYSTYVSKLRGLELVAGRGPLRATEELFG